MIDTLDQLRAVAAELNGGKTEAEIDAMWARFEAIRFIIATVETHPHLAAPCVYAALMIHGGEPIDRILLRLQTLVEGGPRLKLASTQGAKA